MSTDPRGLRLNNPCNVKTSQAQTWTGEIKPTADPEGVLCQFDTLTHGVRVAAKLLLNYHLDHDCRSISDIIQRLSPPDLAHDKNPTEKYIQNVAKWMGLDRDQALDFTNPDQVEDLVACIWRQEQGESCLHDADLQRGVAMALGLALA